MAQPQPAPEPARTEPVAIEPATSEGVLALVQTLQAVPAVPLVAPVAANGGPANGTVALKEEEPASPADEAIDSLVRPLIDSADAGVPTPESVETAPAAELARISTHPPAAAKPAEIVDATSAVEPEVATECPPALPSLARLAESVESTQTAAASVASAGSPAELASEASTGTVGAAAASEPLATALATPSAGEETAQSAAQPSESVEAGRVEQASVATEVLPSAESPAEASPDVVHAPATALATPSAGEETAQSAAQSSESAEAAPVEQASVATEVLSSGESRTEAATGVEQTNAATVVAAPDVRETPPQSAATEAEPGKMTSVEPASAPTEPTGKSRKHASVRLKPAKTPTVNAPRELVGASVTEPLSAAPVIPSVAEAGSQLAAEPPEPAATTPAEPTNVTTEAELRDTTPQSTAHPAEPAETTPVVPPSAATEDSAVKPVVESPKDASASFESIAATAVEPQGGQPPASTADAPQPVETAVDATAPEPSGETTIAATAAESGDGQPSPPVAGVQKPVETAIAATATEPAIEPAAAQAPEGPADAPQPVAPAIDEAAAQPAVEAAGATDVPQVVEPAIAASATAPATEPAIAITPPEGKNRGTTEPANGLFAEALELEAQMVADAIAQDPEAHDAGVRAVAASFEERPKTSLLNAPNEIVEAPAPPASQWIRTVRPSIPPRRANDPAYPALASGPQTSALAGPCLPEQLLTFIEQKPDKQKQHRKSRPIPSWVISLIVATTLFLGVGRFLQYLANNKNPTVVAAPEQQSAQPAAASAVPALEAHPFAKFVEVTGVRVVAADPGHGPQVHYLVVNHSASHISGVALKITVTPSEPSGAAALFTVSSVVPSLGPYQSKEIRTDLDADLRASAIPDWQYLRTEVQVGTQQ